MFLCLNLIFRVVTKSKLTSFTNLKSTGQSKFALEPEKDDVRKPTSYNYGHFLFISVNSLFILH